MSGIFSSIHNNLGGMSVQMKRLQAIAENIANAQRSVDENGEVYKKQIVVENPVKTGQCSFQDKMNLSLQNSDTRHINKNSQLNTAVQTADGQSENYKLVEVDSVRLEYDPTSPNADEQGYVKMADINIVEEMVDMIGANRAYEANISVMNAAKEMAKNTLKI